MGKVEKKNLLELIQLLKNEKARLRAEEKVAQVAQYHRIQNSAGIDAAINDMASILVKAGIPVRIECFHSDSTQVYQDYLTPGGWIGYSGCLTRLESGEILADISASPIQVIQRSVSTQGTEVLEIYVVDDIARVIKEKPNLQGKILLTNKPVHQVKDLVHDPYGARGIIFDGMRSSEVRQGGVMDHARQYTSFWWAPGEEPTFGFVLSPAMGQKIRAEISAGKQILVECTVEAEFVENSLKVLQAEIPGKTAEKILLVAHICHPYPSVNDNASGAGAAVEAILFLQEMIKAGQLSAPERGIELILVPEFSGSIAFLDRYYREGKYLAGLNLDMVGEDQEKCGSTLLVEKPPLVSEGIVADLLYYIMQEVVDKKFRLKQVPFSGGSDHAILSDPGLGIPCPMIIQLPDRYYHTDQDTLDKLDPVILREVTLASAIYLYYLANAGLDEAMAMLEIGEKSFADFLKIQAEERKEQFLLWANLAYERQLQVGKYLQNFVSGSDRAAFQQTYEKWLQAGLAARSKHLTAGEPILRTDIAASEQELLKLVPVRKSWGFSQLSQKSRHFKDGRFAEFWALLSKDVHSIETLAQFWADGERNLYQIMELLEQEIGKREPEFIRDYFTMLVEVGSIEFKA